ncbi:MAG: ribbon-helix-helix domain-containing protein [Candidatus Bathyarchaeia archaeon]
MITIFLPQKLIDEIDALVEEEYFSSRSEAIRTAAHIMLNDIKRFMEYEDDKRPPEPLKRKLKWKPKPTP